MRKILSLLLIIMIVCCACGESNKLNKPTLEQSQVRNIAELATLECYYHNVADYEDEETSGWLFWKKDTKFWIEYEGIVRMGVDASKIKMKVDGNNVKVTIPEAELFDAKVDEKTFDENSFYKEDDSTEPTAEVQVKALEQAQLEMKEKAKDDAMLLATAQSQAQTLIEQYIENVGSLIDREYVVEWDYLK